MKHFDVVVVGGGHAGAEAAHAAARVGARVALVTLKADAIGVMSCNPAIGGLGKGHLVREIDALGGVMGLAADCAGIQFRLLNRRKGPAVQGPRAQADRSVYRSAIQDLLNARDGLEVLEGEVVDLVQSSGKITGVRLGDGSEIATRAVVLTSGTFLRGVIHIGDQNQSGGRMGEAAANALSDRIAALGLPLGRLKTGTPPRLDGRTIDWQVLEQQPGDDEPTMFSFLSTRPALRQVSCGVTHTNEATHEIIRANLSRSAMYGGFIEGIGPRYCPSIEDKVVRFADKSSHQIFLEPEGLTTNTVYPNGISTSLPRDVQDQYVRSIRGLENVRIEQPGYAIEYDYVDPRALDMRLGVVALPGLFLAGQINGTTGYEEAAAQGLVAGLNAAHHALGRDPVSFSRATSYIGVMIDDLTSRGVTEPYRMFTSRAEFRLSLRADNADQRLTPLGLEIGCVDSDRRRAFEDKMSRLSVAREMLEAASFSAADLAGLGLAVNETGPRRHGMEALALAGAGVSLLSQLDPALTSIAPEICRQLENDATYAHFMERQKNDAETLMRDEAVIIPSDLDYATISGLSAELRGKLERSRPQSIGQASRIEGMTPAALTLLLARLRQTDPKARAV